MAAGGESHNAGTPAGSSTHLSGTRRKSAGSCPRGARFGGGGGGTVGPVGAGRRRRVWAREAAVEGEGDGQVEERARGGRKLLVWSVSDLFPLSFLAVVRWERASTGEEDGRSHQWKRRVK